MKQTDIVCGLTEFERQLINENRLAEAAKMLQFRTGLDPTECEKRIYDYRFEESETIKIKRTWNRLGVVEQ